METADPYHPFRVVPPRGSVTTVTITPGSSVFDESSGHEQVVFCQDEGSGLRAIIAIYSTALGPGLGGTRFYPYLSETDALRDVLRLSRSMAYKAALAGLDLGGGKAVIIGDPRRDKTEPLLRAYGRFVQSLHGRYLTACDVGTYSEDMDVIARECDFVTGRTAAHGGAGDSSVLTAFGVFEGMRAAAEVAWGEPTLKDRRVGVAGVGKVGHHLVGHLLADGAEVVVTDVHEPAVAQRGRRVSRRSTSSPDTEELIVDDIDVYAPCALGGAINDDTVEVLKAAIVCGAANNQLAHPGAGRRAPVARDPVRARLLRQLRRADPGRRRARRLLVRASQGESGEDLSHDPPCLRGRVGRRHHHGARCQPDRRAADGGGGSAARSLARLRHEGPPAWSCAPCRGRHGEARGAIAQR